MDFNKLVARVKNMLLAPKTEWPVVAGESTTVPDLYKNYILIVAAIPAIFTFIKSTMIGYGMFGVGFRLGFGAGLTQMILTYALSLGIVYVAGLLIDAFAPSFGSEKNPIQALKSAAYSFTAIWVAGVAALLPVLLTILVSIAALVYTAYLLNLGLPHTMKTPRDRAVGYAVVVVLVVWIAFWFGGMIISRMVHPGIGPGLQFSTGDSGVTIDPDSGLGKLAALGVTMEAASKKLEAAQKSGDAEAEAQAATAMLGAVMGGGAQVESLPPDQLKPFLPETLGGLSRTSFSAEKNGALGMQVSEARGRYSDGQNRTLELTITDTGSVKGLVAMAGWAAVSQERETDTGYEKTYRSDGRLIHEQWDNQGKYGEYAVVLGDRFAVKVSGNADSIDDLKAAIATLDLGALEALKDHGVTRG
jgi:hypothetical protein